MSTSLRTYYTTTTSRAMKMSPTTTTAASRPRTSRPVTSQPDIAASMVKSQAISSSSVASRRPFLGSRYDKSAPSSVKIQPDIAAFTARTQAVPTSKNYLRKSPTATQSLPEEHSDIWIQIAAEEAAKVPAAKVPAAKAPVAARYRPHIEALTQEVAAMRAQTRAVEERLAARKARLVAEGMYPPNSQQQKAPAPRPQRARIPSRGCEEAPQLKGPPKRGNRLIIRAVSISTIASDSDNSSLGSLPPRPSAPTPEGHRTPSSTSTSSNEQMSRISLRGLRLSSSTSTSANEHMSRISVEDLQLPSPEPIDIDLSFDGAFEGTILEDHRENFTYSDLSFQSVESGTTMGGRSATSTTSNEQMSRILPDEILNASLAPKPALKSCLKWPSTKASVKNVAWHPQYMVRLQPKWIDPVRDVYSDDHLWACGKMRRFGNGKYVFGDHYGDTHIGCGCTFERLQNSPRRRFS